ncbi:MAG: chromosome partitioning protein ParB, partial [Eubacteriales bacterium]|nr:chromosome partitioning protein ParB [Eubacteriales bacterium]
LRAAEQIVHRDLSVRETERLIKKMNQSKAIKSEEPPAAYQISLRDVEKRLTRSLGTKVKLRDRQGKGSIQIAYYSNEDLDRLLELLENNK